MYLFLCYNFSGDNMNEYLEFAKRIALFAGKEMVKYFTSNKDISFKRDNTVVTKIDKDINHYLIEEVHRVYPLHSVIGEEEKSVKDSSYVWVCDPVDGTGMYTNQVPVSVFSLALVIDGIPTVGVVYDPYLENLYTAILGEGAYCNGKKIHVNALNFGDKGYRLNYEMWNHAFVDTMQIAHDYLDTVKVSSIGSVARSCMAIASGYFSADLFPGEEHGNCDMAASYLIVSEAGGKVTDMYGNEQRYDQDIKGAIVSNGVSHEKLVEIVSKYIK